MAGSSRRGSVARSTGGIQGAEEAERLGALSASAGVRTWAFVIDLLLWAVLATPAAIGAVLLLSGDVSWGPIVLLSAGLAASAVFCLVQLIVHGRRGVTAGKAAMRLRSVSVTDLGRPGVWRVVLRALVLWVSALLPVVGPTIMLASGLWDRDGRGRSILDRVGGCWVLDVRAGLDPADASAVRRARRERDRPVRQVSEGLRSLATSAQGERLAFDTPRSRAAIVGLAAGDWAEQPAPAQERVISVVPRIDHHLVFEDGTTVPVPAFGLIGRQPEAPPGRSADLLLPLEDPQRMLSKTHVAFGSDAGGVWVSDQGSSNGTVVVGPGGAETEAAPGAQVYLEPGAVVRVGGRMFQVRQGSATA